MGYLTEYTLKCHTDNYDTLDKIADMLKDIGIIGYALYELMYNEEMNFYSCDAVTWYDHDDDMCKVSEAYPDILFELNGSGENSGDIWKTYYKGGKMQHTDAIITFDPFDPSKLE